MYTGDWHGNVVHDIYVTSFAIEGAEHRDYHFHIGVLGARLDEGNVSCAAWSESWSALPLVGAKFEVAVAMGCFK